MKEPKSFSRMFMENAWSLVELKYLKQYLKGVRWIRASGIRIVSLLVLSSFAIIGPIVTLASVVFLLPLSWEQRLWILLGVGVVLSTIGIVAAVIFCSERFWIRLSGIDDEIRFIQARKEDLRATPNESLHASNFR